MKYSSCISIVMATIDYMLEDEWLISSMPDMALKLTEKGFVVEKNKFHNSNLFDEYRLYISPSCLIDMLFFKESNSYVITDIIGEIPNYKLEDPVSYIELVKYIENMRMGIATRKPAESITDLNYIKFKQMISKLRNYTALPRKELIDLKNTDYNSLVNIRTTKATMARRLERMYQVEILLEKYCKSKILNIPEPDISDDNYVSYLEALDRIDLSKHITNWDEFCELILVANKKEVSEQNIYWQQHCMDYNNPMLTVLGLDEIILPGRIY